MQVKIYTTSSCPYCHQAKQFLAEHEVSFEEIVLDKQPDLVPEAVHHCHSLGVPCIHITDDQGEEVNILGFDREKLAQALNLSL